MKKGKEKRIDYKKPNEALAPREPKSAAVTRILTGIYEKEGNLSSERIVELASKENHPLHGEFVWDDSVAGHRYRLHQATAMILAQKFVVVLKQSSDGFPEAVALSAAREASDTSKVRALISRGKRAGYMPRPEAVKDEEIRQAMIERKVGQLRGWLRETIDLEPELTDLRQAVAVQIESFA
jgi:hypothetical protein